MVTQFAVPVRMLSGRPAMITSIGTRLRRKRLVTVALAGVALSTFTLYQIGLFARAAAKVTRLHSKYLKHRDRQDGQADQ